MAEQEEEKNKGGRPHAEINWQTAKNLCSMRHTEAEIAFALGINVNTLAAAIKREYNQSFQEFFQENSVGTHIVSLRQMMWKWALKDQNKDIAKFLYKEFLSIQKNNPDIQITHISISIDDIKKAMDADMFMEISAIAGKIEQ